MARLTVPRQLGNDEWPEVPEEVGQRPVNGRGHDDQHRPVGVQGLAGRRVP